VQQVPVPQSSGSVNESVRESLLFSFEICWTLDYVARTKITQISIIRRLILMITQGRITSMIPTILVI
jgi:hypothetical protein